MTGFSFACIIMIKMILPEFDTRNIKPNLYPILALTLGLFLAVIILSVFGMVDGHPLSMSILGIVYCILVLILLIRAFFQQLEYNPYSYNTIYYSGFAFYGFFVLVTHLRLTVLMVQYPGVYTPQQILYVLLGSAHAYMIITFPLIALFAAGLCISNIVLIRREGFRFTNLLGIILAVLLAGGEIFLYRYNYYASGSMAEVLLHDLGANLFAAVYLYFECMMIGTIIADVIAAVHEPACNKDYLIILGCGLREDGTPTPLLQGRIDRALAFARRQKEQTGRDLYFVPTGGKGPDEVISEGMSIRNYLVEHGVPEERILVEENSADTYENMKNAREMILAHGNGGNIAFSTTNYHVFRSGLYARFVKMRAVGMGAKTKWYFWPNASVREFAGLLTQHRGKQALILCTMIVIYVVLTFYSFL